MQEREKAAVCDFSGRCFLVEADENTAAELRRRSNLIEYISKQKFFQQGVFFNAGADMGAMFCRTFSRKILEVNLRIADGIRGGEKTALAALEQSCEKVLRMMFCTENEVQEIMACPEPYFYSGPAPWEREENIALTRLTDMHGI